MPAAGEKRSSSTDTADTSKKFRSAIDETASEFICPISLELPLEPVTAEDGRVYEKASIEEWLGRKQTSPITNEAMGTRLLPAVQVRSVIRNLVRSGAISGDKADKWQRRIAAEEKFMDTKKRADDGDLVAMNDLGILYKVGEGVCEDQTQALRWYRRAAELGSARGLTNLALNTSRRWDPESLVYLTEAAARGDAWACVMLAQSFAKGRARLPVNTEVAKRWYEKALKADGDEGGVAPDDEDKRRANKWLRANTGVASTWKC
eukprot:COSAG06_NODE_14287_length_1170_cov_1.138189_1_plen_263_part_00